MEIREAVRLRKSIRGYKPDPVPKDLLREILEIATRSPSAGNLQTWEITVVTGEVLENIKRGNAEKLAYGVRMNPDVSMKIPEGDVYRRRRGQLFDELYKLLGITRKEMDKTATFMEKGLRFYDAPAAMILSADCSLNESRTQLDIGCFAQTICLVALAFGLGTCIQEGPLMYPEVVRRYLPIPVSKRMTVSIAIGYPDRDFPANRLETKREPLENIVAWYDFD